VLLGSLLSVVGVLTISSPLFTWSFLVLGSLSICGYLKSYVFSSQLVTYFVVSVVGSLLFLSSCSENFCSTVSLQLSLLLKLGFPPFQFWVFKVLYSIPLRVLCCFLGPFKLGLLFLFVNISSPSLCLVSLSLFLGIIFL